MCGIAGFHLRNPRTAFNPSKLASELLLAIDHRGGDATGYVAFDWDGSTRMQKAACGAHQFLTGWRELPQSTRTVLLHTRLATQGKAAFPENNHPVVCGPVYCTHNGQIWNDRALFGRIGIERMGYVDSEIIPAAIVAYGWDRVGDALEQLDGSYAVALAHEQHPGEVILAKGEYSPLCYVATENLVVWASEWGAVRRAWERSLGTAPDYAKVTYLQPGEMIRLTQDIVRRDEFCPMETPRNTYTHSTGTTTQTYSTTSHHNDDNGMSPKLTAALRDVFGGDAEEEPIFVRCAMCDEWEDLSSMVEEFGELVCAKCDAFLVDDGLVYR